MRSTETNANGIRVLRWGRGAAAHLFVPWALARAGPFDVIVEDLGHVVPWMTQYVSEAPRVAFFHHLHARTLAGQTPSVAAAWLSALERQYARAVGHARFVTESEQSVRDLASLGVDSERVTRIPPGVDLVAFRPSRRSEQPIVFYFGGLKRYKRPRDAIRTFHRIAAQFPTAQLWVAGEGPERPAVQQLVDQLDLDARVRFLGRLSPDALRIALSSSWVNLHTSVSEGWGFSILEASAAGVPTAAFAVPGVSESVRPGINGTLAPDGDIAELSDALGNLLERGSSLAETSRAFAEQFPWSICVDRWENRLRTLA
jgi:glycosyltransferase involved in cell wall biosynthesis